MNIDKLYRTFWPIGQRAINVREALLPVDMTTWHTYGIKWKKETARFSVDGQIVLNCQTAPRGPLGFVMWLDNQFMEITPWGRLKYGLIESADRQWMEVEMLEIKNI